jgi:PPM family protein phosphatase
MENNFRFSSSSVSDRGLSEKRPVNEDSYLELRERGLFAVADGVGGAQAGDFASQMAMETLAEAFNNLPENFDAEQALRIAIQHANQSIFTMSNELPQLSSMATTIVALHVNGNIATVAHVGDSRVYRIEPDGTLKRETADHSVVEEEVRAGRMTPEQALVHPSRNVISRALGAEETVDVEIRTIMVEPGTMFLLCSDGITRHIEDPEIESLFTEEVEPDVLCERMREICYSRGAEDNLTAVVVRISGDLAASTAPAQIIETPTETEQNVELELEEEETVATARSPFDEPIVERPQVDISQPLVDEPDDSETDDEAYLLEEPLSDAEPGAEEEPYIETPVPVQVESSPPMPAQSARVESTPFSYGYEDEKPAQRWGGLLPSILLLLLGGAIGFGGLWFWQQANPAPQVPVLNETKSNNIPLTAFEEARREVDKAPDRYLAANAATPQDAEDHYLLGRAQILTGKYVEAKRQFSLAKERLSQVDASNAKTLAADIAFGTAIADNPLVAEAFAREINGGSTPANANTNANLSFNANVPVR